MLETVKILGEIVFKITNGFGTIIFFARKGSENYEASTAVV